MFVTRFAPSPTGHLHLGHAYSALFAAKAASDNAGTFLLRIEDIDPVRCKESFITDLKEDLRWLGLSWPEPVWKQSEHMGDYRAALDCLDEQELLYPCFCSRREIEIEAAASAHAPHFPVSGPDGPVYPGTCRKLSFAERRGRIESGQKAVWRLDMAKACAMAGKLSWHDRGKGAVEARPGLFGDVVLARKDVPTSYHLSVTVDDHLQGVTLVTRGEDLFLATDVHRLLQALLGYETPEYHHHHLLLNEKGVRFAKRDRSLTIRSLRENGRPPEDVRQMAGY